MYYHLMKENGLKLKNLKSKRYPAETIIYADCAYDLALLANTPAQAKSLLHSLEQPARGIGLYVNSIKTELLCFRQNRAIAILNGKLLKLVNQFIYLSSNISSTESNVSVHIGKAWTAIDKLSIIWKCSLSHEIKCEFFLGVAVSILLYSCNTWALAKCIEKKDRWQTTQEGYVLFWTNLGSSTL